MIPRRLHHHSLRISPRRAKMPSDPALGPRHEKPTNTTTTTDTDTNTNRRALNPRTPKPPSQPPTQPSSHLPSRLRRQSHTHHTAMQREYTPGAQNPAAAMAFPDRGHASVHSCLAPCTQNRAETHDELRCRNGSEGGEGGEGGRGEEYVRGSEGGRRRTGRSPRRKG